MSPTQLRKLQEAYEAKMADLTGALDEIGREKNMLRNQFESLVCDNKAFNELKIKNEALQEK